MKKSWVRAHKSTLDSCCKRILDSISYKKKLLNNWETLPTSFVTSSSTGLGKDDFLGFIATVNEDVADNFK